MAVTTEVGLRVQRAQDITHEDFADAIDRVKPARTPFMSLARNEVKLKAIDRSWNVDVFPNPKGAVGRADNEDAPATGSALSRDWSSGIRRMGNVAQAFSETFRIGWIADVPQIAGVKDIKAYARAGAYEMLKQHIEVAACSLDQTALYDASPGLGAVLAGYYMLTTSGNGYTGTAYAAGQAPLSGSLCAPTGASLTASSASLSATHTRTMWKNVAAALRITTKESGDYMVICGTTLRQAVSDFTDPITATSGVSAMTTTQIRVYNRNESDSVLGATVDTIQTDYGRFFVTDSDYIGATTRDSADAASATWTGVSARRALLVFNSRPRAGHIIKKGNVFKTWAKMPETEELGRLGGGQAFDAKCLLTIGVDNPQRCGTLPFTAA